MKIVLPSRLVEMIVRQCAAAFPEEACGLAGGKDGRAEIVYEIENQLHSEKGFKMEPQQQLDALMSIEKAGLDLLGIYHSHPAGPDHPSEQDIRQAYYPEAAALIFYPDQNEWIFKAFQMDRNGYIEVETQIVQ